MMFGFLIKKSFFDAWDNLLSIVLSNAAAAVLLALTAAGLFKLTEALQLPFFTPLAGLIILLHIYSALIGGSAESISGGGQFSIGRAPLCVGVQKKLEAYADYGHGIELSDYL